VDGKKIHSEIIKLFKNKGFKTYLNCEIPSGFIHGTGHGLGLEIHEVPRISKKKSILREGHVVTVEPGLYYPEWGGIRLEDVIVINKDGCTNLTKSPVFLEIP